MLVLYYCTELLKKYVKSAQIEGIFLKAERTIKRKFKSVKLNY